MEPPENKVNEFMKIYEEVHNEKITYQEAKMMLRRLVHLYRELLRLEFEKMRSEEIKHLP